MTSLVVAEHNNNELVGTTYNTIAAASQIGNDVHVLVAGYDCKAVADLAAKAEAVTKVILVEDEQLTHLTAENMSSITLCMAADYEHIFASATTFGKNFLPRVAALLDVAQISEITAVEGTDTFVRPIYAGNAIATVKSSDETKVITVRSTGFDALSTDSGDAEIEQRSCDIATSRSRYVSEELSVSERPELASAKVVISGGRGMGSGESFGLIEVIADKLGAAIGASRAAVDAGFVPNEYQVGQTGKIVAPDLYIAVGISGAIQHLAGMKDSKVIVAINKDEEAPIFQVADYGLVADLFDALPELDQELA
ncbi:MAG: electron transfer flavoprotein subunit alpha/FixB family protein [Gammaproteobacteria bacterium]|nr:electron transfer flavoprotein subunit alpha/FixB family protein [Gammaproteobacteria bacterium]